MMEQYAGLQPAAVGVLLYLVAWALWRCCLAPAREYEADAEERAGALLSGVLPEKERHQLAQLGYLEVCSPSVAGRVYRIPLRPGLVEVHEAGRLAMRVCVEPTEGMPPADVVLMHKLMIEGNEREYLRLANIQWMRHDCGLCCLGKGTEGAGTCMVAG